MKKSRYNEEQIAFLLKQAELGTKVEEVCRQIGVSQATFFRWKQLYGGDDKILSLYARGMTVREIQGHLAELYGTEVSPD